MHLNTNNAFQWTHKTPYARVPDDSRNSQSGHLSHDRPVVSSGNFPDSSPASARLETRDDEPSHVHDAHDNGRTPDERVCKTIGTAYVETHARLEGKEQLH